MSEKKPEVTMLSNDQPRPTYVGSKTFMDAEETAPTELTDNVDIGVIGVPFDGAASRQPGTRYGPEALRRASGWYTTSGNRRNYNAATGRIVDCAPVKIRDCGDVQIVTNDVETTGKRVREVVGTVAETTFPVVLGGDHYLTYPSFCGVSDAIGDQIGLVHLDSHSDIYGERELHGKPWHGSPMNLINDSAHGGYENHAMIGLRSYEDENFVAFAEKERLHTSTIRDVREQGIKACIEDAIKHAADGVETVYLTVDIDVVDPAFAPGTGTPEHGGLTSNELLQAMDWLGEYDIVGAMDLVEVAPRLDPTRMTHRLGACAIARFLEAKFMS